jgi:acyl-CoA thioesterase I
MLLAPWRSYVKGALVLCLLTVFCAACGAFSHGCGVANEQAAAPQGGTPPDTPTSRTDDERPKIVVLGDSLTAGLGLLEAQSYPHLLQEKIDRDGFHYEVVNAGVSGDTTAGGLRRLDWALQEDVRVLIVALGGNDGLRGLSVSEMKQNLGQIIETGRSKNAVVILAGMEAPPNYGAEYAASFRQAYRELAVKYKLLFIPFLLDKVAGQASLNQADGIHPNPEGAAIVADTVWTVLKPLLDQISVS